MTRPLIAVLDYGIGNLHSAQKSLEHEGADARLTADPRLIADADGVVLPGVGAFGACMDALRAAGLEAPSHTAVASGRPFLGICVGMQMLFTKSQEDEHAAGLDIIPGTVSWIPSGPKIPQMQWNRLDVVDPDEPMLRDLGDEPYVYFVHSLHGVPDDPGMVSATVEYGTTLNAAFRRDNVFAVQFHPEKSSRPGLRLLRNFVEVCSADVTPGITMIDLYPAIDLLGGRVVRLRQGDYADETVYGDDPVSVARGFVRDGAPWIHVVDLDAARSGDPINRPVVAAIVSAVRGDAKVQAGGGVRSLDDAHELADVGVSRIVMGSAAVSDPSLVETASDIVPVAVGLDHRAGEVAVHGWTEGSGLRLEHAYGLFPTAEVFVITDIGRDGMLVGPDVDGLARSAQVAGAPVIASGGVSSLADLVSLAGIDGLAGIITGRAVYEGRFSVADALDALATLAAGGMETR